MSIFIEIAIKNVYNTNNYKRKEIVMKKYFSLYKKQFILGPAFKLAEAILELLVPLVVAQIIDIGIANGDKSYILKMGVILFLLAFFGVVFAIICQYSAAVAQQGVGTHLRNDLFKKINIMSEEDIEKFGSATLITRITNDVTQIQSAVAMLIRLVFRSPFLIAGSLIMAVGLDKKISVIFFVSAIIVSVILYIVLSRSLPLYKTVQSKLDKLASVVKDNLSGVRVVRAFSKTEFEKKRFKKSNDELTELNVKVGTLTALLNPLTFAVLNGAIVLILYLGGIKVNTGSLQQGEVLAFTNYMTQILLSIIVFSNVIVIFTKAGASIFRVKEILEFKTTVNETENADATPDFSKPAVEFDSVNFSYGTAEERVLSNISFAINSGETVGIIGGTGSGKSTLVNLIMRFYDADSGSVKIYGNAVKDYKFSTLRKFSHIVPQKSRLFSGTVKENLLFGNENASDEELIEALKIAQAYEFVKKMPDFLDAEINENSKNLSGGQKQRLCIARALVGKPEILIFDDSSSALDFATDARLRKAIHDELNRTTVITVSQRVNTVKNADRIIVMNDGEVCGIGTHSELFNSNEVYNEICLSQLSEREVGAV